MEVSGGGPLLGEFLVLGHACPMTARTVNQKSVIWFFCLYFLFQYIPTHFRQLSLLFLDHVFKSLSTKTIKTPLSIAGTANLAQ